MSLVIFLFLSLISAILGIYSFISIPNSVFLFLLFSGIIPTGNQFNTFISFKGVHFFDFYFFFIIINYIIYLLKSEIKINRQFFLIIFCILFLVSYLAPKLIVDFRIDKYLLRDFRPFFVLIYCSVFFAVLYKNKNNFISSNKLFFLLNTIFISKIITYFFLFLFPISAKSEFDLSESYRYSDFVVYVAVTFIVIYLTSNRNSFDISKLLLNSTFFLALGVVLVSTNRTLFASLILSLFLFSRMNIFSKLISGVFFLSTFYAIVNILDIERIKEALTYSGFVRQLSIRFYPAIEHIITMSGFELIMGKGIGTTFEIPWFDFREELDPILNNIDSTYFTFYIKYGILSIVLTLVYLQSLTRKYDFRTKITLISVISIIFITIAIPYQFSCTYFIIFSNIFAVYLENLKNNDKKTIK